MISVKRHLQSHKPEPTKNLPAGPKVFLVTYSFHSDTPNRMCLYYDYVPNSARNEKRIGVHAVHRIIELPPELAVKPYDELLQIWLNNHWGDQKVKVDAKIEEATKNMHKSDFLKILEDMIMTSHHKGERANARAVYERISGGPYTGKEYIDP